MSAYVLLFGRILVAAFFFISAFSKAMSPSETAELMRSAGIGGAILWPALAVQALCAVALVLGWLSRPAAFILAMMTLMSAVLFHTGLADPNELSHFAKDLAIAGGLLYVMALGPGAISLSARYPTIRVQDAAPAPERAATP